MYSGDTIQLRVNFKEFNGDEVDPEDVTLIIYDMQRQKIEQFKLDDTNRQGEGVYFYNYTANSNLPEFIFEFSGVYDDYKILARDVVKVKFV